MSQVSHCDTFVLTILKNKSFFIHLWQYIDQFESHDWVDKKHAVVRQKGIILYRSLMYRTLPFFARNRFDWPHSVPTVFRYFYFKARTLPRFKFSRFTVLTLIFRISANHTVPKHERFDRCWTFLMVFGTSLFQSYLDPLYRFLAFSSNGIYRRTKTSLLLF